MSFPSRTTLRAAIVTSLKAMPVGSSKTLILADKSGQEYTFDYLNKAPEGMSPFACVESGSAFYPIDLSEGVPTPFTMVIGFWVRREDGATTENLLDDLALALATMLHRDYSARFVTQSVTDYEVLDGIQYKFELHFVEFEQ